MSADTQDKRGAAIDQVIVAGELVTDSLSRSAEHREQALAMLERAVDAIPVTAAADASGGDPERQFLQAADDLRAGYLLVQAARSVENGERNATDEALAALRAERARLAGGEPTALFFDAELVAAMTQVPRSAAEALELFKERSKRTIDNMVTEARDVIATAIDKIKDKFDDFVDILGGVAHSFSVGGAGGVLRKGLEKIVSGLQALAGFLKSDVMTQAIEHLRQLVGDLEPARALALAFRAEATKRDIDALQVAPSMTAEKLVDAANRLADLAKRYVVLLERARWAIVAIGAVGGLLALTGVAAQYSALAVPIAYAVVALAVVAIGMDFADAGPVDLVPGFRALLQTLA